MKTLNSFCLKPQEPLYLECSITNWTLANFLFKLWLEVRRVSCLTWFSLEKIWKFSCLTPSYLEPWYLICSITQWYSAKFCSNYWPWRKLVLFCVLVWNHKAYSLDIRYVASSSGPPSYLFNTYDPGDKNGLTLGPMFYNFFMILYRENTKRLSCLLWNFKAWRLDNWSGNLGLSSLTCSDPLP